MQVKVPEDINSTPDEILLNHSKSEVLAGNLFVVLDRINSISAI